jgi:hypothetical protein
MKANVILVGLVGLMCVNAERAFAASKRPPSKENTKSPDEKQLRLQVWLDRQNSAWIAASDGSAA